jgi:hypothetical protein
MWSPNSLMGAANVSESEVYGPLRVRTVCKQSNKGPLMCLRAWVAHLLSKMG